MKVNIGTSGWSYNHWKGCFYPPELPRRQWLSYIASVFNTVEINATFYRQPRPETFSKWHDSTPDTFRFSIKANRFITHVKKLRETEEAMARFYASITPLKGKIGAILFQLPPSLTFDLKTMEHSLKLLHHAKPQRTPSILYF